MFPESLEDANFAPAFWPRRCLDCVVGTWRRKKTSVLLAHLILRLLSDGYLFPGGSLFSAALRRAQNISSPCLICCSCPACRGRCCWARRSCTCAEDGGWGWKKKRLIRPAALPPSSGSPSPGCVVNNHGKELHRSLNVSNRLCRRLRRLG